MEISLHTLESSRRRFLRSGATRTRRDARRSVRGQKEDRDRRTGKGEKEWRGTAETGEPAENLRRLPPQTSDL